MALFVGNYPSKQHVSRDFSSGEGGAKFELLLFKGKSCLHQEISGGYSFDWRLAGWENVDSLSASARATACSRKLLMLHM